MPTIRPLAASDCLLTLTALLHVSYASLAAQGWNFTAVDQPVDVTRDRLAGAQGFVAELDGRLVGTVAVRGPKPPGEAYIADPPPPLYTTPGTAILSQLAVHPDCRGPGSRASRNWRWTPPSPPLRCAAATSAAAMSRRAACSGRARRMRRC
jgi:hypothetical protein